MRLYPVAPHKLQEAADSVDQVLATTTVSMQLQRVSGSIACNNHCEHALAVDQVLATTTVSMHLQWIRCLQPPL
eukprot:205235-Pelagomonas_calceolata.AAC.6